MTTSSVLSALIAGDELSEESFDKAFEEWLAGTAEPTQMAAVLSLLSAQGEPAWLLTRAVRRVRAALELPERLQQAAQGRDLLDTCGTGGDGLRSFNVSTAVAIVVAAAGVGVAKHGNRAVSSRSGSADALEALGVSLSAKEDYLVACLEELNLAFFFAPTFHTSLGAVGPLRRALGVRTLFNQIGPLLNPLGVRRQLVGVYAQSRMRALAEASRALGAEEVAIVHADSGLDEVDPFGSTHLLRAHGTELSERRLEATDFGHRPAELSAQLPECENASQSAAVIHRVLDGDQGGARELVVANAALALQVARPDDELRAAQQRAYETLDSGAAKALLGRWVELGRRYG